MKKLNLAQFTALVALAAGALTNAMQPSTGIYLENNYGAILNYRKSSLDTEGERIGNNVRVLVGDAGHLSELSIRATGRGSQWVSSYYDLGYILKQIKLLQAMNPDNDAVISVGPSRMGWSISYRWEPKSKTISAFEYEDFPTQPITPITPIIEQKIQTPEPAQPAIVPTEEVILKEEPITIKEEAIAAQVESYAIIRAHLDNRKGYSSCEITE